MGLLSLVVGLLFFASSVFAGDCGSGAPKQSAKSGAFKPFYFGEGGGKTPPMTPDQSDYCETASRDVGKPYETETAPEEEPETSPSTRPQDAKEPPEIPDASPVETPGEKQERDRKDGELRDWNRKVERAVDREKRNNESGKHGVGDVRSIPRRWPGPRRRPAKGKSGAAADSNRRIMDGDEELRDAPAAAGRYSLWNNLSTPLLLPATKVNSVPLSQAQALGRRDYEDHILAARMPAGKAVDVKGGKTMSGRFDSASPVRAGKALDKVPIVVELDVKATPGEYRDAVAGLSAATGFTEDERFSPRFLGVDRTRVSVRGWLLARRFSEITTRAGVLRVVQDRAFDRVMRPVQEGLTDVLVGLRIPPESSPTEALKIAVARLGDNAGFQLMRTIGYQRVPGTSMMVLIVAGRVPVRRISQVLADPAVVKVAPAPKEAARRVRQPRPFWRATVPDWARHPVTWALALMLGTMLFMRRKLRR